MAVGSRRMRAKKKKPATGRTTSRRPVMPCPGPRPTMTGRRTSHRSRRWLARQGRMRLRFASSARDAESSPSSDYGWDEGPQQHSSSTESLAPSSAGFGGSTSTTTEERPQTTEARPAAQFSGVGSRGLRIGGTVAAALAVASLVCFWCALASL